MDLIEEHWFDTAHVTFQTKALAATSFRVDVWEAGAWRTVAEVTDNDRRRRVVSFDRIFAPRLRVVLTEAPADVAVSEVRVYDEL